MYAFLRGTRTVAHLTPEKFGNPICGRGAHMTSNLPGGRRECRDCARIADREADFHGTLETEGVAENPALARPTSDVYSGIAAPSPDRNPPLSGSE